MDDLPSYGDAVLSEVDDRIEGLVQRLSGVEREHRMCRRRWISYQFGLRFGQPGAVRHASNLSRRLDLLRTLIESLEDSLEAALQERHCVVELTALAAPFAVEE